MSPSASSSISVWLIKRSFPARLIHIIGILLSCCISNRSCLETPPPDIKRYLGDCEGRTFRMQCFYEYGKYYKKINGDFVFVQRKEHQHRQPDQYDCRVLRHLANCIHDVTRALNQNHHVDCVNRNLDSDVITRGYLGRTREQIERLCWNFTRRDHACVDGACPYEQQLAVCRTHLLRDSKHTHAHQPHLRTLSLRERALQSFTPTHSGNLRHIDLIVDLTAHLHLYEHVDVVAAIFDSYPFSDVRPLGRLVQRKVDIAQWEVRVHSKRHKKVLLEAGRQYFFSINVHGWLRNGTRIRIRNDVRVPKCTEGLYRSPYPGGHLGCKERLMNFPYDTYFRLWQDKVTSSSPAKPSRDGQETVLAEQLVFNSRVAVGNAREFNKNCSTFYQTFQVVQRANLTHVSLVLGARLPLGQKDTQYISQERHLLNGTLTLFRGEGETGETVATTQFEIDCANLVWRNFSFPTTVTLEPCVTYSLVVRGRSDVGAWLELAYNILTWHSGQETAYSLGYLHNPYYDAIYPLLAKQTDALFRVVGRTTDSEPVHLCRDEFATASSSSTLSAAKPKTAILAAVTSLLLMCWN